jgi:peroxiredoxin
MPISDKARKQIYFMKKHLFTLLFIFGIALTNVFAQTGLPAGTTAPVFSAKDNAGKTVDLKALLKKYNSVVLIFYRGEWCPFCNKQMQHMQDSLSLITGKNAYVLAVTPETTDAMVKTVQKTHASFSLVHDEGYKIMKDYKVDYKMDEASVAKYKGYGIDLEKNNGNTDHMLPVPATYIINKSGKIIYAHFDKDFRNRAPISTILAKI